MRNCVNEKIHTQCARTNDFSTSDGKNWNEIWSSIYFKLTKHEKVECSLKQRRILEKSVCKLYLKKVLIRESNAFSFLVLIITHHLKCLFTYELTGFKSYKYTYYIIHNNFMKTIDN